MKLTFDILNKSANVTLAQVVQATLASIGIEKGKPFAPDARMKKILTDAAAIGIQSTGIRSIRFIRNTQTKIVRPSGAISRLLPWNVSLTLESTKSTIISTASWVLLGTPDVAFFATRPKIQMNNRPRNTDQNIESTLIAIGLPAH